MDASALVASLHGRCLRATCACLNSHKDGLSSAARSLFHKAFIPGKTKKKLMELDTTFHVVRHINVAHAERFAAEFLSEVDVSQAAMGKMGQVDKVGHASPTSGADRTVEVPKIQPVTKQIQVPVVKESCQPDCKEFLCQSSEADNGPQESKGSPSQVMGNIPSNVDMIIAQVDCSRDLAVAALHSNGHDLVSALISILDGITAVRLDEKHPLPCDQQKHQQTQQQQSMTCQEFFIGDTMEPPTFLARPRVTFNVPSDADVACVRVRPDQRHNMKREQVVVARTFADRSKRARIHQEILKVT